MLEIAIIVFMALAALVALFGIIFVICDYAKSRKKTEEQPAADSETEASVALASQAIALAEEAIALAQSSPVQVVAAPAPSEEEPVAEPAPAEAKEESEEEEGETPNVAFVANSAPTHGKKYAELDDEARGWYDEIAAYAASVEGAKRVIGKYSEEYKIGNRKIVRFTIRKGVTVCEFILRNNDFAAYVTENKVAVSNAATAMRVTSEAVVQAAKGAIDIVVKGIEEERAAKRRLANEKRRARYAAANAEAPANHGSEESGEE